MDAMENSGEDISFTGGHSFSGGGGSSSEESGWTSYIDYFVETQQRQRGSKEEMKMSRAGVPSTDDDATGRCSSTSECSIDTAGLLGASTCLPPLAEPSVVSRRLSLREGWRRKKKKALYDESLEDTATSPISNTKLIELRDSDDAHHKKKVNSRDEISHSKRKSTGGDVNNGANTTIDTTIKEDTIVHMTTMS